MAGGGRGKTGEGTGDASGVAMLMKLPAGRLTAAAAASRCPPGPLTLMSMSGEADLLLLRDGDRVLFALSVFALLVAVL
eukprot:24648-Eustigmatos_ZCMA.PRE.1